jgi:GNAT superfamily N-acetyltransferase
MSNLTIQRVVTARQKRQFLQFPWTLYRGDPNWIPPLRGDQKELVGYKPHPFYARNSVQTFIACRGGEVCGRIAAILNQGHITQHADRRGFFGFFDCMDDQEAANGLFDAVRKWFADQDIHRLRGPTNPSLNHELGLLIEGFDSPPTFMMTYNPPYYERLVENYGFRKTQDLYAFWGQIEMLPKISQKLQPIAEQIIERFNVKLRSMDTSRFQQDVEMFLDVYNRSLTNTWGFVPMSAEEMRHMARGLKHVIVPEMAIVAEIDDRVVGVSFGLPDYNPRIKEIDGRLFPFGFFHLLRNKQAIKRIRIISTNVLPEFQRMGVGLVLLNGLVPKAMEWGIQEAEFSWVLESNSLSYGSLKKGGAKITKTYRLYDWEAPEVEAQGSEVGGQGCCDERDGSAFFPPRPP